MSAQYAKNWNTGEVLPNREMRFRFTKNYESGGAGICTTVDEYSKIIEALANGGIGRTGRAPSSRNRLPQELQLAE